MTRVDVAIIGAGVVGAAIAEKLSHLYEDIVIFESHDRVGEGVSSRNSGVIHSGIYYPPASLKAKLCIRGKTLLYEWARKHDVPHAMVGKAIVASDASEESRLEEIYKNALASGATGLKRWSASDLARRLPGVRGTSAVFASETGIVDAAALVYSLLNAAESRGAHVLVKSPVTAIEPDTSSVGGYLLRSPRGDVNATRVFNCAGLHADEIAALAGIDKYKIYPCRGDYYRLKTNTKFEHLVYPVQAKGATGLGVHLTLDMSGAIRLGPDTEYVSSKCDFSIPVRETEKRELFRKAAEKFLGPLSSDQLEFDQCGLRPKLRSPLESAEKDFVIAEDLPGFFNLVGIESPGLTASLAIAEDVANRI